jgi:hypothetical protein
MTIWNVWMTMTKIFIAEDDILGMKKLTKKNYKVIL